MKKEVMSSPIRWAGSKKKLLNEMLEKAFVKNKTNYVECFLGSGVVLLNVLNNINNLNYKNFYVNDINSNIINFYTILQKNPKDLLDEINKLANKYNKLDLEDKSVFFYNIRDKFNNTNDQNEKTVLFYFLMKTGFNGVYRENSKGYYNVPFGKKEKVIVKYDYLLEISNLIKNVKFYNMDFYSFLKLMKEKKVLNDSFVYCDPPYLPDDLLVYQKQILYTKDSFNHQLLFESVEKMKIKNMMISMAESKVADQIYNNKPLHKVDIMEIIRVVNPKKLFSSKEIAYINYKIEE